MFSVYYLADPRTPTLAAYFGRTHQHVQKRCSDHISGAKFAAKNNKTVTPIMRWILSLLEQGLRPVSVKLMDGLTEEQSIEVEENFIAIGGTLNSPNGHAVGGRPVGSTDSPEARARKSDAWKRKSLSEVSELRKRQAQQRRINEGYPHPELPTKHPLNEAHNRVLRNKNPRKSEFSIARSEAIRKARLKEFYDWRVAVGFPNPNEGTNHPDNCDWALANHGKYPRFRDWVKTKV